MGILIKFYGLFLVVLCAVLVAKCEEFHHIAPRTLENEPGPERTLPSISSNPQQANDTEQQAPLESSDPSAKLEKDIELLAVTSPTSKTTNSDQKNTSAPVESSILKTEESKETNKVEAKFNVSSLLRANSSVLPGSNSAYIGVTNISAAGIQAPEVFPNGSALNGTQILEGDKDKLQDLISHQNSTKVESKNETSTVTKNQTGIDTEVPDLLNKTNSQVLSHQHPLEPHEPLQISDKFNDETEEIENGKNTEDQLRKHKQFSDLKNEVSEQKYLAAIIVSSLVLVSVLSYAALLAWRRYLENRYGSRTMLVNEEDFDDPNDMRHFSI